MRRFFSRKYLTPSDLAWRKFAATMCLGLRKNQRTPKSNYAVIGIYLYDTTVFEKIHRLKPSGRGELEITDVNNFYVEEGNSDLRGPRRLVDRCGHV